MLKRKSFAVLFWILSAALILLSCVIFAKGFDVKDNYYSSENYPSLNMNAYVGGDAYNYIINGTYFAGYSAIGSAAALGAVILLCTGAVLYGSPIEEPVSAEKPAHEKQQPDVSPYSATVSFEPPESGGGDPIGGSASSGSK